MDQVKHHLFFIFFGTLILLGVSFISSDSKAQTSPLNLPLFDSSQIRYLGQFTVDAPPYGGAAVGVSEDGKYIYTSCWGQSPNYIKGFIAKLQIPALGGHGAMVQPCQAGVTNAELAEIDNGGGGYFPVLGSILENNGKFIIGGFITYDAGGVSSPRKTFWSGSSLGSLVGPYEGSVRNGLVKGQSGIIPLEWRSLLGGDSYVGAGYSSIVSRSSYGPAFTSFYIADAVADGFPMNFLLGCPYYEPGTTNYLAKCDTRYGSPQSIVYYNGSEQSGGAFFVPGTRTLVAIERESLGPTCYGYATRDPALHGTPYPGPDYDSQHVVWCYSLSDTLNEKGPLGYPYQLVAKLFDLRDLVDVKNGIKKAWDVDPYSVVYMPNIDSTPEDERIGYTGGGVFNPVTGEYYLTREMNGPVDVFGGFGNGSGGGGGGGGGDTTSPTVSLTAPTSGATVSGSSVSVSANASDNVGVVGVQFKLDGTNLGSEDTSSPYQVTWDTTGVSNGSHTLTATARDSAGNTTNTTSVSVTVSNTTTSSNIITLNPNVTYQTMRGWEAVSYMGLGQDSDAIIETYKNGVLDKAVDLGINRVRIGLRSGSENIRDYWLDWKNAGFPTTGTGYTTWRAKRYETVNDNSDPNVANPSGFYFGDLDREIELIINPWRAKMSAQGKKLYVNLNYTSFYNQVTSGAPNVHANAAEYAEFILVAFQHIQQKYGWVPDALEIILEPDNTSNPWNGTYVGQAIVAVGQRLAASGFTPDIIAPSTTCMNNAVTYFDQMINVSGVLNYLDEISYHRYCGVDTASLQAIATRAKNNGLSTSMLEWWAPGANTFQTLHEDLKVGRNSAWQQLGLAETNPNSANYSLGLTYVDPSNPTNIVIGNITKFNQQYYKYIKPGAVRIDATSNNSLLDPLAFINSDGKYTVVVKATGGDTFSLQGLPSGTYGIYYTISNSYDPTNPTSYAVANPDQTISAGQTLTTNVPNYGVITVYQKTGGSTSDTTSPTVSLTAPTSGATVSGSSVSVSANASDNVGVVGVQFKLDGTNLGSEDTSSPYQVTWDTTGVSNGSHTLTATARDSAGNTTTSSSVSVTVSNPVTFQRTIQIDLEGRANKVMSGTLSVLNTSKSLLKTYPFTTNSSGQATITFDISPQTVYLKLNPTPFLTKLLSLDLNTNTTYTFPKLLTGDIVQDNIVNSIDYSSLNSKWFTSNASADLNGDGLVNSVDFSYLNRNWLVSGDN